MEYTFHIILICCLYCSYAFSAEPVWRHNPSRIQAQTTINTQFEFTYSSPEPFTLLNWTHQIGDDIETVATVDKNGRLVAGIRYQRRVNYLPGADYDSAGIEIESLSTQDDGEYHVFVQFANSTLESDVLLRVYTDAEIQGEVDEIKVYVNSELLPPGETLELEPGDVVVDVVFKGTTAPDLVSDIMFQLDGDDYTAACYGVRSCSQTLHVEEEDNINIGFNLGFEPTPVIQFPQYAFGALYAEFLWTLEAMLIVFGWVVLGIVCLGILVVVITVPLVIVKSKREKNGRVASPLTDDATLKGSDLLTVGYVNNVNASLPRPSDNVTGDAPPSYAHVITVTGAPDTKA